MLFLIVALRLVDYAEINILKTLSHAVARITSRCILYSIRYMAIKVKLPSRALLLSMIYSICSPIGIRFNHAGGHSGYDYVFDAFDIVAIKYRS